MQDSSVRGRFFILFLTGHTGFLAYDDDTMVGRVFNGAEYLGLIAMIAALIGFIDAIVNDVMPERFHFRAALTVRHFVLMTCAAFFSIGAWLASHFALAGNTVPYFVVCCLFICQLAFFDIRRRFKK